MSDFQEANLAILDALDLRDRADEISGVLIRLVPSRPPAVEVEFILGTVTDEGRLATELRRYELVNKELRS